MSAAFTEVIVKKGPYEVRFRIDSGVLYDSDLQLIKHVVHHFHGICSYDQKTGDRPIDWHEADAKARKLGLESSDGV